MQFKAGYIADSIAKVITDYTNSLNKYSRNDEIKLDQINGLLQYVCAFDVDFPFHYNPDFKNIHPVLATINNIIIRGLPTRAPIFLENVFANIGLIDANIAEFEINFPICKKKLNYETIFELLHIIEPNLEITRNNYGGNLDSNLEWEFLIKHPFLIQILESQRDFSTINSKLRGNRRVDFCFTSPYLHWNNSKKTYEKISRIFEIDGPHHSLSEYRYYDAYRDAIAQEENFETIRFTQDQISQVNEDFDSLIDKPVYQCFKKNFERNVSDYLVEYSLIFIPLAVARIQKTILEIFLTNPEIFSKKNIKIAIIERDFPCGALAIKSLQEIFDNLNALLEDENKLFLPEINLTVFENKKWVIDKRLHLNANLSHEKFFLENHFDIIIDHSILRRSKIFKEDDFQNNNAIKIRSSHYFDSSFENSRKVYCADLLHYKPLVKVSDDGSYVPVKKYENHITFFIQNIFRKKYFREGQLPIISRAIQLKPVIGLLPTGAGKSLTYQLSSFLQPGLCLVVDPLKSLMEDQVRVLKQNWIDNCDFINSNLSQKEKVKKLVNLRYGESQFLFISPERLVMQDFREIINSIDCSKFGLGFSFCVIDEVHCVSEWGHDFRSTYLLLGKNAQRFAKTRSGKPVSLIGLTATASFDVLADVERELQIKHHDAANAIIMIENTIRPELFFRTIMVNDSNRLDTLNNYFIKIGSILQELNNENLIQKSKEHHINNFIDYKNSNNYLNLDFLFRNDSGELIDLSVKSHNDFCSLIFCPVVGRHSNPHGVEFVYTNLISNSKGFFFASETDEEVQEVKTHFENFLNDKIKHMVCTKAFGLGIDKKDIRFTFHYVFPSSLESLVQEAGRAGRDQKISISIILISTTKNFHIDIYKFFSENFSNPLIQNRYTRKAIRHAFSKKWSVNSNSFSEVSFDSLKDALKAIDLIDFSLLKKDGSKYNLLPPYSISELRSLLKERDEKGQFKYIIEKNTDREIHNFFYNISFQGIDTEKNQFLNLFKVREFQVINDELVYIENQDTLANTFENCKDTQFDFIITSEKKYPDAINMLCKLLNIDPNESPQKMKNSNNTLVKNAYNFSNDFDDFLFLLHENNVINISSIDKQLKEKLLFVYNRDRKTRNDTGKLLYRMHSMGFLENYTIDYRKNSLFNCIFNKFSSVDDYLQRIEDYLRRYLSENSTIHYINELKKRLNKPTFVDNIIECLYFLSEFSYKEIASKRKRATDEIEFILNTSISDPNYTSDWFQQNLYLKEQIYFYFNAKYARINFEILGKPYSLLVDYTEHIMSNTEILEKYLNVFHLDGTEQNNYKHMIGSCKKILRSLSESDFTNDWLLRLLKAFSMYSVNNDSYILEANADLELAFDNLYNDVSFHQNDFSLIESILHNYFIKLKENITPDNPSFRNIELIRIKLLLKKQSLELEKIINKYFIITKEQYA